LRQTQARPCILTNSHPAVAFAGRPASSGQLLLSRSCTDHREETLDRREIQSTSRKAKQSYQPAEGSQQSFALSYRNIAGSLWPESALPAWNSEALFSAVTCGHYNGSKSLPTTPGNRVP